MSLPANIDPTTPAGTEQITGGDDQIRALKLFIADLLGIPVSPTNIAQQLLNAAVPGAINYVIGGGTANAHTAAFTPAFNTLVDGMEISFRVVATNTSTSVTFTLDSISTKNVRKRTTAGAVVLAIGDLRIGAMAKVIYSLNDDVWILDVPTEVPLVLAIPAGTVMSFFQAAAPTGWTQVTSQNNKVLRVVSGPGGGSGGSWATSSGVPAVGNHTHTSAGHTHTISHTHSVPRNGWGAEVISANGRIRTAAGTSENHATNDNTTGGSSSGSSGSTTPGATGSAGSVGAQVPAYIDMILASKD